MTPSEGVAQRERGFDGAEVVVEHFVIEQDEIDFRGEGNTAVKRNGNEGVNLSSKRVCVAVSPRWLKYKSPLLARLKYQL